MSLSPGHKSKMMNSVLVVLILEAKSELHCVVSSLRLHAEQNPF